MTLTIWSRTPALLETVTSITGSNGNEAFTRNRRLDELPRATRRKSLEEECGGEVHEEERESDTEETYTIPLGPSKWGIVERHWVQNIDPLFQISASPVEIESRIN
jgi:hypothetical protein